MICPGFIDLHINGAVGYDFLDANLPQLEEIAIFEAQHGTTGFLPTLCTAPQNKTIEASLHLQEFARQEYCGAKILGIHLEGPFFNPKYKRVHPAEHIRIYTKEELDQAVSASGALIKMFTLAPEMPTALDFIGYLQDQGIVAAIGHTNATAEETIAGIEAGIEYATHIFCAMKGIHHREPGAAGISLMDERVTVEVLSDRLHLHPDIVRLVYQVKGAEGIVLSTDAMAGAGIENGEFLLAGRKVRVVNGKTVSEEGRIAGGIASMDEVVRNASVWLKAPVYELARMASLNPSKVIGLENKKGSIQIGKDADIILCDKDYNVKMTMVEGTVVHCDA
jgi:N-acetylglucosamine-6-phosphate deacetylase